MQKYLYLREMLALIEEPNRSACLRILKDNEELFKNVPGAAYNHQNWPGGYWDHVREIMNIALVLYKATDSLRKLPFSISDALLILFLHDLEKPWKYEDDPDGKLRRRKDLDTPEKEHQFKTKKFGNYGIVLTLEQKNAMRYVHGELYDYSPVKRVMGPLAAFCHNCDVFSARIWFDYPKENYRDSWWPAQRVNSKR